jgi:hypothetical protein
MFQGGFDLRHCASVSQLLQGMVRPRRAARTRKAEHRRGFKIEG